MFFALVPDAATAARMRALAQQICDELALARAPLPMDRLHMTMSFVGAFSTFPAELARRAAAAARALSIEPFDVVLDRLATLSGDGRRPLVLQPSPRCAALATLEHGLRHRLAAAGIDVDTRREFLPHVTLMYAERSLPQRQVASIALSVRELALVRSHVGKGRHEVLERFY